MDDEGLPLSLFRVSSNRGADDMFRMSFAYIWKSLLKTTVEELQGISYLLDHPYKTDSHKPSVKYLGISRSNSPASHNYWISDVLQTRVNLEYHLF